MQVLSNKAFEVMKVVIRANPDGSWVDLDQLLERLTYKPSKQSIQFSIRALIKRGLLEKKDPEERRGASRRILAPTAKGLRECRGP
jgi:DNA-binding MarR family transcriptional regulator